MLTALPALLRAGLLRHAGLLTLPKGFYGLPSLLLLWALLLLGRVRSAERLRYQQPGEWGALLGLDRCPCPRTLRRRTRQLAASDGLRAWVGALAREWREDDPETVATLFVDGHVQVYSGKGNLPKHFVPRQKLALPAAAGYWVHALGGAPLLCLHRQVDAGMVSEIWNRIVPQPLELAGKPGPGPRQPALVTTHPSLTAEQAAGLLRSRWTQENFFNYSAQCQSSGVLAGAGAHRAAGLPVSRPGSGGADGTARQRGAAASARGAARWRAAANPGQLDRPGGKRRGGAARAAAHAGPAGIDYAGGVPGTAGWRPIEASGSRPCWHCWSRRSASCAG